MSGQNSPSGFERMRKRAQFRLAAKGGRFHATTMSVQAAPSGEPGPARFGFTVTRQVGNAVERNRIRRRMREALRLAQPQAVDGAYYVFLARRELLTAPFLQLRNEILQAICKVKLHRSSSVRGRNVAQPAELKTFKVSGTDRQS